MKPCINIDHIEENRWRPSLVDADWHAFCQAIFKGIEGSEWEELHIHYREMCKAAGAKKPSESQKAKALWVLKASKDRREEFYHPARKENKQTKLEPWEELALDNALKCQEIPIGVDLLLKILAKSHAYCNGLHLGGLRLFAKDEGKFVLGRCLALLGPVGQRAPVHGVYSLESSREVWATWRALFLPHKEGAGGGFK